MFEIMIFCIEQAFGFGHRCVELDPVASFSVRFVVQVLDATRDIPVEYVCLLASMPDFTSQSDTPSVVFFAGAKILATFSADQCLPVIQRCVSVHKYSQSENIAYQSWGSSGPRRLACTPQLCVSCSEQALSAQAVSRRGGCEISSSTDEVLHRVSHGPQSGACHWSEQQDML